MRIAFVVSSTISRFFDRLKARRYRARGTAASSIGTNARFSASMLSLFPCLHNKNHRHEKGRPHTCNSFLLGPSNTVNARSRVMYAAAHTIVLSGLASGVRRAS